MFPVASRKGYWKKHKAAISPSIWNVTPVCSRREDVCHSWWCLMQQRSEKTAVYAAPVWAHLHSCSRCSHYWHICLSSVFFPIRPEVFEWWQQDHRPAPNQDPIFGQNQTMFFFHTLCPNLYRCHLTWGNSPTSIESLTGLENWMPLNLHTKSCAYV